MLTHDVILGKTKALAIFNTKVHVLNENVKARTQSW